jgi:hypothetical protein
VRLERRTISFEMSTRFFNTALTTGMTGSSIDPDLAASLKARDRRAEAEARTSGRSAVGFSTLLGERSRRAAPRKATAWCRLRHALKRLSEN